MNKHEAVLFLFTIAKEIQLSFITPVILFTQKDFAVSIFNTLVDLREALLGDAVPEKVADIIYSFHMNWLHAVKDVEKFRKSIKVTPRDVALKAIDFTIECTLERYNYLRKYIDQMHSTMTDKQNKSMQGDLLIIKDMQKSVNSALLEKQQYISSQADQTEYHVRIHDEIEELMNWLDRLNDSLAIQFCKVVPLKDPVAPSNLTKTLKQIIDEAVADPTSKTKTVAKLMNMRSQIPSSIIRTRSINELEIERTIDKIKTLEDRISQFQSQSSSALLALQHKTIYLEERLESLENIKKSMNLLKKDITADEQDTSRKILNEYEDIHIFNHLLPHHDRCRLVEQLIELWNSAILVQDSCSIVSIMRVEEVKNTFSDEYGNFTVDKYGRKIYSKPNDDVSYQLNEYNKLVPLHDDENRIYDYDSCGRYYLDDVRQRLYKHHDGASEYAFNDNGNLVKVMEEVDGVEYYYDWLGRYYINEEGQNIYCEESSLDEYEHDGLGNLVKIQKGTFYYAPPPIEPITLEENKYLKQVVGDALKICIAEVVTHQPSDPIADLADRLSKYCNNIKAHQKQLKDEQDRYDQSKLIHTTQESSLNWSYTAGEADNDKNFIDYEHDTDESF